MVAKAFQALDEIDGFPVRVRYYNKGRVIHETTLKSATSQTLGEDQFSPPDGYKVSNLADQLN